MPRTYFIAMALTGSALAAVPASAGDLLGAVGANCLCQTVNGLTSGGYTAGAPIARGIRQDGLIGRGSHGKLITNRSIAASVTGSVNSALNVTVARPGNRHGGHSAASVGLAGRVSGAHGVGVNLNGGTRSIGLAGASSSHASAGKVVGLSIAGLGTHGKSLSGQVANVSVLNKAGGNGRPLANVAVLNGSGGTSGKLANVSVLNKTGTTGRSLANVAVLNGSGGTSGKLANVSVLNKTGTTGRSLANVAALNGSAGGTGRLANVSVLNGRHGNGNGGGNGGLGLPNGVQIINGVPCGPDGKPLTGVAATTVLAIIGSKGHGGDPGHGSSSPPANNSGNGSPSPGNAGNGSPGTASGGSPTGSAANGGGGPREREMADRKDLWWPPQPERQSREGRLNDH